jgi:hypothetical protein
MMDLFQLQFGNKLVVITYAFPADGGSRGLTANSLGLVEVSLFIRSCQLVAHVLVVNTYAFPADGGSRGLTANSLGLVEVSSGGNYLCFSCRWWE